MEGNIALGKEKDTEYATQRYHKIHLNALCLLRLADCSVYPCSPRTINFYQFVFLAVFFFCSSPPLDCCLMTNQELINTILK